MKTYTLTGKDEAGLPVEVTLTVTPAGIPPIPPPPPPVTHTITMKGGFQPLTLTVKAGETVTFQNDDPLYSHWVRTVTGSAFDSGNLPPGKSYQRVFSLPGTYAYFDAYGAGPGGVGPWNGTVVVQGQTPAPSPPGDLSVKQFGAQGDGVTDDAPAIQKAIAAAKAGQTIRVPAGSYLVKAPLAVPTSGLTFQGDGDASRILHGLGDGFHVGTVTTPVNDTAFRQLAFVGAPGQFNADGNNQGHSILCDRAGSTSVQDCLFLGPAHAVYEVNQAVGLLVERCRVQGWGRVAFGVGDGATIRNCTLTQNYPDPTNRGIDYGFGVGDGTTIRNCTLTQNYPDPTNRGIDYGVYLHNACKNVLVEGCRISGCGGYALHYWAQANIGSGGPVTIQDCTIEDCWSGLILASSPGSVGRLANVLIQRNTWRGISKGSNVVLRMGDGVCFLNNTIDSGAGPLQTVDRTALAIGLWGPNDTEGLLTETIVRDNQITGWDFGLYAAATNGGRFVNVSVGPNTITNCRRPLIADPATPGLTLVP